VGALQQVGSGIAASANSYICDVTNTKLAHEFKHTRLEVMERCRNKLPTFVFTVGVNDKKKGGARRHLYRATYPPDMSVNKIALNDGSYAFISSNCPQIVSNAACTFEHLPPAEKSVARVHQMMRNLTAPLFVMF
jgi:hypothetical protein